MKRNATLAEWPFGKKQVAMKRKSYKEKEIKTRE